MERLLYLHRLRFPIATCRSADHCEDFCHEPPGNNPENTDGQEQGDRPQIRQVLHKRLHKDTCFDPAAHRLGIARDRRAVVLGVYPIKKGKPPLPPLRLAKLGANLGKRLVGPPREIDPKAGASNSSQCHTKGDVDDMGEVDLSRRRDVFITRARTARSIRVGLIAVGTVDPLVLMNHLFDDVTHVDPQSREHLGRKRGGCDAALSAPVVVLCYHQVVTEVAEDGVLFDRLREHLTGRIRAYPGEEWDIASVQHRTAVPCTK